MRSNRLKLNCDKTKCLRLWLCAKSHIETFCQFMLFTYALVSCRLDCCNLLMAGLPLCDIQRFLSVENSAAGLFGNVSKRGSGVSVLRDDLLTLASDQTANSPQGQCIVIQCDKRTRTTISGEDVYPSCGQSDAASKPIGGSKRSHHPDCEEHQLRPLQFCYSRTIGTV